MIKPEYEIFYEDAIKLLPDGDEVHTFRNPTGDVLVGADWERADLLVAMARWGVMESGEAARAMKHGLVLIDESGPLFIETAKLPDIIHFEKISID